MPEKKATEAPPGSTPAHAAGGAGSSGNLTVQPQLRLPESPPVPLPSPAGDPLADCLRLLAARAGRRLTREQVIAGIPLVQNRLDAAGFVRAAERLGFSARLVETPLDRIDPGQFPVVVLLRDGGAALLASRPSPQQAELQRPGAVSTELVPWSSLAQDYAGRVLLATPVPDLEDRLGSRVLGAGKPRAWFWRVLFSYRAIYFEVAVATLVTNLLVLASPLYTKSIYDRVLPNQAEATLWVLSAGVALAFIFDFMLRLVRAYFLAVAGKRADVVLASRIFGHLLALPAGARPGRSGELASRIREFESVRDFFSSATLAFLIDLPFVGLFLVVLALIDPAVALVPLVAVPVLVAIGTGLRVPLESQVESYLEQSAGKAAHLQEAVAQLEGIKAMGAEGWIQARWEAAAGRTARLAHESRLVSALAPLLANLVQQAVTVGVVAVAFYRIRAGAMTTGGLVAASILASRCVAPLAQVATLLVGFSRARAALDSLDALMAIPAERDPTREYARLPPVRGALEAKEVTFTYPGAPLPALKAINLRIEPGERIGILGRVGSGKSTLLKVLLGLLKPDSGMVLLDGLDMAQLDPVEVRRRCGSVAQVPALFSGTLRDNLLVARPGTSEEELRAALEISGLAALAARHPLGLDLPVGEGGAFLSGGQRQMVALARALLDDPRILFLDEPTANLDGATELFVIDRLGAFARGRTFLMATHKTGMLGLVDRILVIDDGRVVADGPREAVLRSLTPRAPREAP